VRDADSAPMVKSTSVVQEVNRVSPGWPTYVGWGRYTKLAAVLVMGIASMGVGCSENTSAPTIIPLYSTTGVPNESSGGDYAPYTGKDQPYPYTEFGKLAEGETMFNMVVDTSGIYAMIGLKSSDGKCVAHWKQYSFAGGEPSVSPQEFECENSVTKSDQSAIYWIKDKSLSQGTQLWKLPKDGKPATAIAEGKLLTAFTLGENQIWYSDRGSSQMDYKDGGIYQVNKDGSGKKALILNQSDLELLDVWNDRLWWKTIQYGGPESVLNINSSPVEKVDVKNHFQITSQNGNDTFYQGVYYLFVNKNSNGEGLMRINLQDGTTSKMPANFPDFGSPMTVSNGYVLWSDHHSNLVSSDSLRGVREDLSADSFQLYTDFMYTRAFAVFENNVYYANRNQLRYSPIVTTPLAPNLERICYENPKTSRDDYGVRFVGTRTSVQ
jgi:hypothetical protein